jgi:hypothetical protein
MVKKALIHSKIEAVRWTTTQLLGGGKALVSPLPLAIILPLGDSSNLVSVLEIYADVTVIVGLPAGSPAYSGHLASRHARLVKVALLPVIISGQLLPNAVITVDVIDSDFVIAAA